jgi:hypothetical protein
MSATFSYEEDKQRKKGIHHSKRHDMTLIFLLKDNSVDLNSFAIKLDIRVTYQVGLNC